MSENYSAQAFEPSTSGKRNVSLLGVLIGGAACLAVAAVVAALVGLGWLTYDEIQSDNATATAQAQLPPSGWSLIIDEQFASNLNDWDVGTQEIDYGTAELDLKDETYYWHLKANSDEGISWWQYPFIDRRLGDFYVTVECHVVSGETSHSACGLAFRVLNGKNYYRFTVMEDQRMGIMLVKKGEWVELLPWETTDVVHSGEINQLAILAEGIHYKFFINTELVYEVDDDRLAAGRIGLLADVWGENPVEVQFDNFQVYEP